MYIFSQKMEINVQKKNMLWLSIYDSTFLLKILNLWQWVKRSRLSLVSFSLRFSVCAKNILTN